MIKTENAKKLVQEYERLLETHPSIIRNDIDACIKNSTVLDDFFEKVILERKRYIEKWDYKEEQNCSLKKKVKTRISHILVDLLKTEIEDIEKTKEKNKELKARFEQIKYFM